MGEPQPFKFELKKDPVFREHKDKIELPQTSFSEEVENANNYDGEGGQKAIFLLDKETQGDMGRIAAIKFDYPQHCSEHQLLKIRGVGIDNQKYIGQGIGILLYKKLLELAKEKGLEGISSDSVVQGGALAVWKKLKDAGYDINVHPDAFAKWQEFLKTYDEGKMFKESISVEKTDSVFKILSK